MEGGEKSKKEMFNCISCLSLVKDPVECLECETLFCKACFDSWFL